MKTTTAITAVGVNRRRKVMANNLVRGQCHFCKATPPVLGMLFHEGYFFCEQRCIDGICEFATENTNIEDKDDESSAV